MCQPMKTCHVLRLPHSDVARLASALKYFSPALAKFIRIAVAPSQYRRRALLSIASTYHIACWAHEVGMLPTMKCLSQMVMPCTI